MFDGIQSVPDKIRDKAPLQRDGVERGHRIARPDSRKEDIADERDIITKSQNKEGWIQAGSILKIKNEHKRDRKKIVAEISKGEEIGEPGDDPLLHPECRINPEQIAINLNQGLVDIGMEIMDQISKRLVNKNDKKDGGKGVYKISNPTHLLLFIG
jgi:hypothetical protein